MGRENYLSILARVHTDLRTRRYVEIGIGQGRSLSRVPRGVRTVAVDPSPRIEHRIGRAKVFRTTSDAFFSEQDLTALLGGPVDLGFIDGMHLFEFALRDFRNLEAHCTPDSIILVHDCYPVDEETARRERSTRIWSGDVWKLIVCLKEYRPDLRVSVADVPPTGLGIITNLDPESTVLAQRYDEILARFLDLPFEVLAERQAELLNHTSGDWPTIRSLLPSTPFDPRRRGHRPRHSRSRSVVALKRGLRRTPLGPLARRLRGRPAEL
jgi:Methyltransferase domain